MLSLVSTLFLVLRASHKATASAATVVTASADLVKSFTKANESNQGLMVKHQEFTLGAIWKFHERAWMGSAEREVAGLVNRRGLTPFMSDPNTIMQAEIRVVMQQLGLTREQAILYMRSRIETPTEESVANGAG